jgi:hypothetical protein
MRLAALVPAGFALGALACALLLHHAPSTIASDLAQPLVVVTYWHSFGSLAWLCLFGAVVISSVGYLSVMVSLRNELTMTRTIMLLSALACAAALAFPVIFSSDVYAYAAYGNMALHGIDPYAHARIDVHDPLFKAVVWQWGNPPPMCVYGPAFVWLAKAIVALFLPLGVAAPLWAFRVLACIALVACAPLAYAAFKPFPQSRRLAAAAGIALNPIAIWSCAEGHNDIFILASALAGFALAVRWRAFTGALVVALAALVKAPALAAAGAFALHAWKSEDRTRVLAGVALGTLLALAIAAPLELGVRAHLAPGGHYAPQLSLQYLLATLVPLPTAVVLTCAASAVLGAVGLRLLYLRDASGAVYLAFAAWLLVPNPYPWYALWILPVAFLAANEREMWAVIAASLLAVFRYYAEGTALLPAPQNVAIVLLQIALPLALLMAGRKVRARRDRPEIHTPAPDFAPLRFP